MLVGAGRGDACAVVCLGAPHLFHLALEQVWRKRQQAREAATGALGLLGVGGGLGRLLLGRPLAR
eukprot:3518977-Prymnesium_polylepis.1